MGATWSVFMLVAFGAVAGAVVIGFLVWLIVWLNRRAEDTTSCGQCGYSVRGLTTFTCPECGSDLREVGIVRRRRNAAALTALVVLALLVTSFVICGCMGWFFVGAQAPSPAPMRPMTATPPAGAPPSTTSAP